MGRSDVTAVQAAVQWIMRDGVSMLGGLLFTSFSSSNFGQNIKSWRLFADLINNVGISLDMIAPIFRPIFFPLICISSICKSLCGIAAGSTGAAIAEHWGGKHGNIPDVLAKNGAQHTMLSLIGLSISVPFARFANKSHLRLFILYSILTSIHIYSNIQAMKSLALRSINISRYHILCNIFLSNKNIELLLKGQTTNLDDSLIIKDLQTKISLKVIAKMEPLFSTIIPSFLRIDKLIRIIMNKLNSNDMSDKIHLWTVPSDLINQSINPIIIQQSLKLYYNEKYCIIINYETNDIYVCFHDNCDKTDQTKALFEATIIQKLINFNIYQTSIEILEISQKLVIKLYPLLWKLLILQDFDVNRILLTKNNSKVFNVN